MARNPSAPSALRLFVALWPDAATREALAAWQQAWTWPPRAAPVKADRLHLTLHFLGDVPAQQLPDLIGGLNVPFEPFELPFGHGEVWPNGVAVLRPAQTPPALAQLHARLGAALLKLELPAETRPFRAHVTLARRAWHATAPERAMSLSWQADAGYVLVRSQPGGAGYQTLARFG
jgi:2'-5' RNA ligase